MELEKGTTVYNKLKEDGKEEEAAAKLADVEAKTVERLGLYDEMKATNVYYPANYIQAFQSYKASSKEANSKSITEQELKTKEPDKASEHEAKEKEWQQKSEEYHNKALSFINASISINPNYPEHYVIVGDYYLEKAEYEDALISYQKASYLVKNNAFLYFKRGTALLGVENTEQGMADWQKATELNPDSSEIYFARGYYYLQNNEEGPSGRA